MENEQVSRPDWRSDPKGWFRDWFLTGPQTAEYGEVARTFGAAFWALVALLSAYFTLVALTKLSLLGVLIGAVVTVLVARYAYRVWTRRAKWLFFFF